ncbi:MAG TPA: AzlC family ABC transporter permease [Motiliproteus sp.]
MIAPNETPRQAFMAGAKATLPLIVGAIPFGILFGTLAGPSGLSLGATLAMSLIVFAGSAQFIALGLLAGGAGIGVIIATTLVVNLRHLLYSAALVERVKHLPQRWRIPMAFWLTDETFAAVSNRLLTHDQDPNPHWFYLGSALAMYGNWQLCTWLGLSLGELFPDMTTWGLDFAMSVTFLGMVAPYLRNRPMWLCVIGAGIMAMATWQMPHKLGLIVAALCGIAMGYAAHKLAQRSNPPAPTQPSNPPQEPAHD